MGLARNGKTVVEKKTVITNQDGTKTVTEEVIDNGKRVESKYVLGANESAPQVKRTITF
jgi:hypothetical protein